MLVKCSECGKEVSDQSNICVGCGAPIKKADPKPSLPKKPWYERTSVTIGILFGLVLIGLGFVHVVRSSKMNFPELCWKASFGYSETFINIDEITGMPIFSAKSKFPLSVRALQENGYVETDEQIQRRVQGEFERKQKEMQERVEKNMEEIREKMKTEYPSY